MSDKGFVVALRKDKKNSRCVVEVYDVKSKVPEIIKELVIPDASKIISMESSEDLLILTLYSKKIVVMDLTELEIIHIFSLNTSCEAPPYVLRKFAYFIIGKGVLCKINFENAKEIQTLTLLDSNVKHPATQIINVPHPNFEPVCMGLMVIEDRDIVVFKNSILETFRQNPSQLEHREYSRFKLTCCGTDISHVNSVPA
eukprot:TRINITY_DN11021_c0_g4_i3.p3 TRINITY_DN11021_c0_g4~~TRINITY_DN11021_c0_g4_i3.p3  ORF type:complete len:199 (+),score=48.32 TRINITY_DN11021_c0_g4_i3:1417-2013(+)